MAFQPGSFSTDALLYACGKLARPVPVRDHHGRMRRAGGGEWDWFYELEAAERRWISARFMAELGPGPDEVASFHGVSVDEAMARWLMYVRLSRSRDVFDDDYQPAETGALVSIDALVGPCEAADLLGVRTNTLAQWRSRFGDFPEPLVTVSGMRIWHHDDIVAWARVHGRLVESA